MPEGDPRAFRVGVVIGLIVALVITYLIAIGGAFVGGLVAGWVAGGGRRKSREIGGRAGVYTGLLDALALAAVVAVLGIEAAPGDLALLRFLGSTLIITLMFFPVLGFVGYLGGVLGGALKER
ncbi:MAG: DUF5518 domain-containing protein [Methanomicrobiaceae archaeon]|uniref:DUF5518 domain-containing protein n=1 Tax=Methanoculleus sp. TaxID=90427 RepID=UPI00320E92AD|nr:DUF5518 domain-containing protein [Methanomicrobiaceae archaeon]